MNFKNNHKDFKKRIQKQLADPVMRKAIAVAQERMVAQYQKRHNNQVIGRFVANIPQKFVIAF